MCSSSDESGPGHDASAGTHAERMLHAAVHGSPVPQFVIDREHRVVHWNRALEVLTGLSAQDLVGTDRHWSAFYPAPHPCLADLLVDGQTGSIPSEYSSWSRSTLVPDGYEATAFVPSLGADGRWLHFLATLIHDDDGTVIGAVETLEDITARKRTEEALRESEERYRAVFDASHDAIMIHDLGTGAVVECNRRAEELYGFTREEFQHVHMDDCSTLGPSNTLEAGAEHLRRAAQEGPQVFEWHARRHSGEAFWVEVSLKRADIGGESYVIAAVRDIGERKQAEEALLRAEEEMARILNSTSEIITHFSPDMRILWANRTASESARASTEEMHGRRCFEFYHHRGEPCEHCPVILARDTGEAQEGEMATPDGRVWSIRSYPVKDGDGKVIALSEFRFEITERKRAEEARQASEERYRRITEAVTDYIYTVDLAGGSPVSTRHGAGCVAVTGYTSEEFAEDPDLWLKMVVAEDRPIVLEAGRRIRAAESLGPVEHRIVRKDGEVRWVRSTTSYHCDTAGSVLSYDGLVQDITEQKRLQAQLLQSQKMEAIGRLAGGVAHDFNNLLTAVMGYAQLLQRRLADDSTAVSYLRHIERAGERASDLTKQLLAFARKQLVEPRLLDLNGVVEEATRVLIPLLGEDVQVHTYLDDRLWSIEADPGQLQQVIVNMAVNARDAMPRGGSLTIETSNRALDAVSARGYGNLAPGSYVVLAISDTGVGMEPDVVAHLFEPFFTTKPQGKGTGLGLATCHGIVHQCGGHIRVYSEPGCGTTLQVLLPRAVGGLARDHADSEDADVLGGTETILVAEDEAAVRSLAALALRSLGYTVLEAHDGPGAIALANANLDAVDLLITDVIMPGMNGREVADRVRDIGSRAKVLFVSGHAETAVAHHGVLDPGIAFLAKPFAPDRLARKVREVLDGV